MLTLLFVHCFVIYMGWITSDCHDDLAAVGVYY